MALGKVICVPDPAEAAARDDAMSSAVGPGLAEVPPLPGIDVGLIHAGDPHAGRLFVQGTAGDAPFDDVHGAGWRLVGRGREALEPDVVQWFASIGGHVVVLDGEPTYRRWFDDHDVRLGAAAPRLPPLRDRRAPPRTRPRCSAACATTSPPSPAPKEHVPHESRQQQRAGGPRDRRPDRRHRRAVRWSLRPRPDEPLRRLGCVRRVRRRRHRRHGRARRGRSRLPGAVAASGVRHRPQLPQPRRGVGHGRARRPGDVHQVPRLARWPVRRHRDRRRSRRLGGRARRRRRRARRPSRRRPTRGRTSPG